MSPSNSSGPVWLITGGGSGFGLAIAKQAAAADASVMVAGLARSEELDARDDLIFEELDVCNPAQVAAVVQACVDRFGKIDVLVNNAGYSIMGAFEDIAEKDGRQQVEVNLFGTMAMTRAVLPHMRAQRKGLVINLSSVGGFEGACCGAYYAASKFAVEGFSEAMAKEVASLGIKFMIIEPGSMRTNFRGSSMRIVEPKIKDYESISGPVLKTIKAGHGQQAGNPDRAAQILVTVANSSEPPMRLPLGRDSYARIRGKLENVTENLKKMEPLSIDIAFEQ